MSALAVFVWTASDVAGLLFAALLFAWFFVWGICAAARKISSGWSHKRDRAVELPLQRPRFGALTFDELRYANLLRLPLFRNRKGGLAHAKRDGSDWCLAQWCNAVTGELGEAANIIKKIERGDMSLEEAREDLARELADVQTYLDLLAYRAGVNLGDATITKWNEVSHRIGVSIQLRGTKEGIA